MKLDTMYGTEDGMAYTILRDKMLMCAKEFILAERVRLIADGPQEEVKIVYRDVNKWAVMVGGTHVLDAEYELLYESMPSSRTDEFKEKTRFSLKVAWDLAERYMGINKIRTAY